MFFPISNKGLVLADIDPVGLIENLLTRNGVSSGAAFWVSSTAFALVVLGIALLSHYFAKNWLARALKRLAGRSRNQWDDLIVRQGVFSRAAHVVPALVFYAAAGLIDDPEWQSLIRRVSLGYMAVIGLLVLDAV